MIDVANDPAIDQEVRSLPEAYRTASGVAGRVDPDGELVRAVVPDLKFVGGDVCWGNGEAERVNLPGRDRAAGVRTPAEVVAGAIDHETPRRRGKQFIERTFNKRGTVLRPANAAGTYVDHARLCPRRSGDEVDRLEQPHRVAEVGQPTSVAIRQMDEYKVGIGGDASRPAALAVPGGDIEGAGAVRAAAAAVRDRRVVSQPLVGPRVSQRAVDLLPAVDGAVPVWIRAWPHRLVPLIPERQEPGAPRFVAGVGCRRVVRPPEGGRVHIYAPVDGGHHHARPGQPECRAAPDIGRALTRPYRAGQVR